MSNRHWSQWIVSVLVFFLFAGIAQATPLAPGHYRVVSYRRTPQGDTRCVQIGPEVEMSTLLSMARTGITEMDIAHDHPGKVDFVCGHTAHSGRTYSRNPSNWERCVPGAAHRVGLIANETYCLPVVHQPTETELLATAAYDNAQLQSTLEQERTSHAEALAAQERGSRARLDQALSQQQSRQQEQIRRREAFAQGQMAELHSETSSRIRRWFWIFALAAICLILASAMGQAVRHRWAENRLVDEWQLKLNEERDESARQQAREAEVWRLERNSFKRRNWRTRNLVRRLIYSIRLLRQTIVQQSELSAETLDLVRAQSRDRITALTEELRTAQKEKSEHALLEIGKQELEEDLQSWIDRKELLFNLHARLAEIHREYVDACAAQEAFQRSEQAGGITQEIWNTSLESDEIIPRLRAEYERASEIFVREMEAATGIRLPCTIVDLLQKIESQTALIMHQAEEIAEGKASALKFQGEARAAEAKEQKALRRVQLLERYMDEDGTATEPKTETLHAFGTSLRRLIRSAGISGSPVQFDRPTFFDLLRLMAEYRTSCPVCVEKLNELKHLYGDDDMSEAMKEAKQGAKLRLIIHLPKHFKDKHGDLPPPSSPTLLPQAG